MEVVHYWFTSWPDHGVPSTPLGEVYPDDALRMLVDARKSRQELAPAGPMVVHCSAGIGRTGTFITMDHVMSAIEQQEKIDINRIVELIREDRLHIMYTAP